MKAPHNRSLPDNRQEAPADSHPGAVGAFARYFVFWRTTIARDREMVEAVVQPDHVGPSHELRTALERWPGVYYWSTGADANRLVLVRAIGGPQKERWWLHGILFLGTFFTVWMGGVWMGGALLLDVPTSTLQWFRSDDLHALVANIADWARASVGGLSFAMALMGILLSHEMGHYFAAKRYGINVSPPFFLPAPIEFNFIGTFGAFIRLRSPVVDRRQLMDIGAAGPWVGFVISLVMLGVGLHQSFVIPADHGAGMIVEFAHGEWRFGDSLLTLALRSLLVGEGTPVLHPLAVAGWVGMLVTALNLLPLGQLDGGHIFYALFGDRQRYLGVLAWIGLVIMGAWFWPWWFLAVLILVLGGGRLAHPRVLEYRRPLPPSRRPLGWASILLLAATFTPVPILI